MSVDTQANSETAFAMDDGFIAGKDNGFLLWKQQARSASHSEAEKGRKFEEMMIRFLLSHPQFKERFTKVMLWDEWAASLPAEEQHIYSRQDLGIDLVGVESGINGLVDADTLCGIQVKFYADDAKLNKASVESFLSALGDDRFASGILCHTANELSKNVWEAFSRFSKSVQVLDSEAFREEAFSWSGYEEAAEVAYHVEPHDLRKHQKEAKAAWDECADDKARITLPCGSGKTLLACRIAEDNKQVLVLVPSISLIAQSIREFSRECATGLQHRYIAVCSDRTVGQTEDKQRIYELTIPATTDAEKLKNGMLAVTSEDVVSVVFATYQSIGVVRDAQQQGAPAFDVVICDEAHRTTGLAEIADDPDSETESTPFKRICEPDYIAHDRKLFMTATPIVYADSEADRAAKHGKQLYSMEDETVYGKEIYKYSFADAIDDEVLCDYQVLVAAVEPDQYRELLANPFPYTYTDNSKSGRRVNRKGALPKEETSLLLALLEAVATKGVRSAITFAGVIKKSKSYRNAMPSLLTHYNDAHTEQGPVSVEVRHVDGEDSAAYRSQQLRWLGEDDGTAKILSNAQCLSEGVDVPALDAVAFLTPRASVRECVQAVGRVMRIAPGKKQGTVIIPLVISSDDKVETADDVVMRKQSLRVLVSVLQALRSHDERLNRELNKGDISRFDYVIAGERITGEQAGEHDPDSDLTRIKDLEAQLPLDWVAVASKVSLYLIDQLSSDRYWEDWAADMAWTHGELKAIIKLKVDSVVNNLKVSEFRTEIDEATGQTLGDDDFLNLLACHTITAPLFDAIYPEYDILVNSVVAERIQAFLTDIAGAEIEAAMSGVKPLKTEDENTGSKATRPRRNKSTAQITQDIAERARDIKDPAKRAEMTKTIYERLLFEIMYDDALAAGVGYTPIPVVDFLTRSSDDIMRKHFGIGITSEDVVVYEPFAGTSSFITRMLTMENLIDGIDFWRKYEQEIYTQELLVMPYYVGDLAIEEAAMARMGERRNFENSIFGDTFATHEERGEMYRPDDAGIEKTLSEISRAKQELHSKKVTLVLSNPPYTSGKRIAEEGVSNRTYEKIEARMDETYGRQKGQSVKALWAKAVRMATDRIDDEAGGMVSYVLPTSWIRARNARGFRKSVAEEFDAIYVLDCLGGVNGMSPTEREWQGEPFFGEGNLRGVRIPLGLCIFIRNPSSQRNGTCEIFYKEIGYNLTRKQKYNQLTDWRSMSTINDWMSLQPDERYDWLDQISPDYENLLPLGNEETKAGKEETAIFKLYSLGIKTGEDERAVNSNRDILRPIVKKQQTDWNTIINSQKQWEMVVTLFNEWKTTSVAAQHQIKETVDSQDNWMNLVEVRADWDKIVKVHNALKKMVVVELEYKELLETQLEWNNLIGAQEKWMKQVENSQTWEPQTFRLTKNILKRIRSGNELPIWNEEMIRRIWYRPFFWQQTRWQASQNWSHYRASEIYPYSSSDNLTFAPAQAATSIALTMGEYLHHSGERNCYPLYSYDEETGAQQNNITDYALTSFRNHYGDHKISKEDIFYYVYASFNREAYRTKWPVSLKSNTLKHLRVEMLPDFYRQVARGHTLNEACHLLDPRVSLSARLPALAFTSGDFTIGSKKMKDDRSAGTLRINYSTIAKGLPDEMWEWEYNGRSIIWWLCNRWKTKVGKLHEIPNNPNDLFDDPQCAVAHFGEWLERCAHFARVAVRIDRELDDNGVVDVNKPLPAMS